MGMNSTRVLVINDELCDVREQVVYEKVRQKQISDTVMSRKGKLLKGKRSEVIIEMVYKSSRCKCKKYERSGLMR